MNLNHLKAFEKLIQVKSFQEAARQLSVSQPAITLRIQALEEHFKTKLVKRTGEGVQLTSQGEVIYKRVKEILKLWEDLEVQFLGGEPVGKLVIGASTIPSEYILPKIIKKFKSTYPDVDFSMRISGSKDVVDWLKNRLVDIAITGEPMTTPLLYSRPIVSEKLSIIAPLEFIEEDIKQFRDLFDVEWILREKNSDTRSSLEKTIATLGFSTELMKIVGELGSTEAVIAAVEAGLGITVVSSYAAERAAQSGRVKIINLKDFQVTRNFYFSCLEENKNLPVISAFLGFIEDSYKDHN
ncbi:selenium metabolism-associated LysR family transcriptional regulator [Schinkia azotoformans]|uniref:selenium metabolism-associated LysR family transcriptional regulator n=1 Tax=Schinkia azotoformans TaxID=1454 RepID=UPI002DBDE092|nr:selenium metabolism-associated LysR family transcriptional regulator [Schinkia azotoformans]MEC1742979.1 selenium metabolism-associated LysR family transcriptional regulator [Schinkia azotoformans]MEC1745345.1 selenium metabolism-associated LysR family transcriptional regulator [Schinkia azotoformans]MEC1757044.1 selenium metabolism-associated LysR family transcriptional regulator [Schinkia azotoformans]MEC1768207.1 selenium metabolism-associated LysR family transcriptional regulator [Schink